MPKKIEPAVRERVMRMIAEHCSEYATPTELARVLAARERLGVETVRRWIVQAEVDVGIRPGVSSTEHAEIKVAAAGAPWLHRGGTHGGTRLRLSLLRRLSLRPRHL